MEESLPSDSSESLSPGTHRRRSWGAGVQPLFSSDFPWRNSEISVPPGTYRRRRAAPLCGALPSYGSEGWAGEPVLEVSPMSWDMAPDDDGPVLGFLGASPLSAPEAAAEQVHGWPSAPPAVRPGRPCRDNLNSACGMSREGASLTRNETKHSGLDRPSYLPTTARLHSLDKLLGFRGDQGPIDPDKDSIHQGQPFYLEAMTWVPAKVRGRERFALFVNFRVMVTYHTLPVL